MMVRDIIRHIRGGARVFWFGNGGSAAIASHAAAELMVRYKKDRAPIPSICLNSDTALITAHANDLGYESLFCRQVEALCRAGDVVIGMTTSGTSANVLMGLRQAASLGCLTVALTGPDGLKDNGAWDFEGVEQILFGQTTTEIQVRHLTWIHNLCEAIDGSFN